MGDISHRGFRASVFVRRSRGAWEVMTTIYVPEGLVNEIGDQVIMDVDESTTNRIEHVRSKAFEQAKKAIDEIIAGRVVISLPAK